MEQQNNNPTPPTQEPVTEPPTAPAKTEQAAPPQTPPPEPPAIVKPVVSEPPKTEPTLDPQAEPAPEPSKPGPSVPTVKAEPEVSAQPPTPTSAIHHLLIKAREKIQFRKRKKLNKVLALARERGNIANDDVQKLLRVSDATATRYLVALVKSGQLKRTGHPRHARYEPLN
ncbi:MAG: hypothetical protein Q8Q37_02080 [bacterium]|nr:hypothetical protein [bacterium]